MIKISKKKKKNVSLWICKVFTRNYQSIAFRQPPVKPWNSHDLVSHQFSIDFSIWKLRIPWPKPNFTTKEETVQQSNDTTFHRRIRSLRISIICGCGWSRYRAVLDAADARTREFSSDVTNYRYAGFVLLENSPIEPADLGRRTKRTETERQRHRERGKERERKRKTKQVERKEVWNTQED